MLDRKLGGHERVLLFNLARMAEIDQIYKGQGNINAGRFYIRGRLPTASEPLPARGIIITAAKSGNGPLTLCSHSGLNTFTVCHVVSAGGC